MSDQWFGEFATSLLQGFYLRLLRARSLISRGVPARWRREIFQIDQAVTGRYHQGRQGQTVQNVQSVSGAKRFAEVHPLKLKHFVAGATKVAGRYDCNTAPAKDL
ncbi:MAG: hypothetical protein ACREXG_08365 [Polaromonas sp.]